MSFYELALIAFILAGIGFLVWRGGAANPVGTGKLQHDVANVRAQVTAIGGKVKTLEETAASKDNVDEVKALLEQERERIEARLSAWERKMDHLDARLDSLDVEVGKIQTSAKSNHKVTEAMAESLRITNDGMQDMRRQVEASAAITVQVPGFIETVRSELSRNTARTEDVCKQVDRLYDFIVERGMSK